MKVIGVMTGTSIDAIDVALCEIVGVPDTPDLLMLRLLGYQEVVFPDMLHQRILCLLQADMGSLAELTELNFLLGEALATAIITAIESMPCTLAEIDLIASHGQTIYHLIEPGRRQATWQMGEAAVIAARTGRTVIADFRVADMARGGQGAPLVSFLDALMFADSGQTRALQNIGGIANVTFLPAGAGIEGARAFDTGPGNVLIDYAIRHFSRGARRYDRNGALARAGHVNRDLLNEALEHPYFRQIPPKTTGRELFGDAFAGALIKKWEQKGLSANDIVATCTALTAMSIAAAYRDFGPSRIDEAIISGGGAYNPVLMEMLGEALPAVQISRYDSYGLPSNAKEAVAFALLGYETLHGRPSNVPACTGAHDLAVLGKITPGANFRRLLCQHMSSVPEENGQIRIRKVLVG